MAESRLLTYYSEVNSLLIQRYPERQEDQVKKRLWEAYRHSGKTVDFIVDFIENADGEDDFWN